MRMHTICISIDSHLNQQANDIVFDTAINSHNFYRVSFSKNLDFLINAE